MTEFAVETSHTSSSSEKSTTLSSLKIKLAKLSSVLADTLSSPALSLYLLGPQKYAEALFTAVFGAIHGKVSNNIYEKYLTDDRFDNDLRFKVWLLLRALNINMQLTLIEAVHILSAQDVLAALSIAEVGLDPNSVLGQIATTILSIHLVTGLISFLGFVAVPTGIEVYKAARMVSAFAGIRGAFTGTKE